MHFNKGIVIAAFQQLNDLTDRTGKKATEQTSALRYLVAASALIKKKKLGDNLDLAVKNDENRNEFIDEVGKVVKIKDGIYTNNFFNDFQETAEFAVRANFLTTRLKNNGTYPGRPIGVIQINNESVSIIPELKNNIEQGFQNFVSLKTAFVIWLLRNENVSKTSTVKDLTAELNKILSEKYENILFSVLKIDETEVTDFLNKSKLSLKDIFSDKPYDFSDFLSIFQKHKLPTSKEIYTDNDFGVENIVYYGPPGTGKTRRIFLKHLEPKEKQSKEFITFHQAYSYEEFVEGIKPGINSKEIEYEYSKGIFYQSCEKAAILAGYKTLNESLEDTKENRSQKYKMAIANNKVFAFCIDEINRANIAGVFGDLITLIESNKRLGAEEELIVKLPYSKSSFGVPPNLQIIGSMNTADRSITLIDTALRRRFIFVEIAPEPEVLSQNVEEINLSELLFAINNRIKYFLGKDQCIGHAYLIDVSNKKEILAAFLNKIIPLLEEYFYNDTKKISLVLGDSNKADEDLRFFIRDENSKISKLFPGAKDDDIDEKELLVFNNAITNSLIDDNDIPAEMFSKIYS